VLKQTDKSDHAEGLYLKVEDEEQVLARYKLVRHDFTQPSSTAVRTTARGP
jgi:hypothetical protein